MRTKRIKLFTFDELSKEAKEVAIEKRRNIGIDVDFIYDDAYKTVEAFHEVFGTNEIGNSWLDFSTSNIEDGVLNLKGLRLQKYVMNNFYDQLYKGKYYSVKSELTKPHRRITAKKLSNGKTFYAYYSAITKDNSCVLTGVCYDDSLLQPVYNFIERYKDKADYYSYMDMETLIYDCFSELKKDIENEVEGNNSDEAIAEMLSDSDYEFTEDGKLFNS